MPLQTPPTPPLKNKRSESVREQTVAAKAQLDRIVLQLHNLLYEKQFYEKEVLSCTNFRSAVADEDINLIPTDECCAAAPAAAAAAAAGDEHALMLARLQHELDTRKALTAQLKARQSERAKQAKRAAGQKGQLDALQASLRGLEQAGRPLAAALAPRVEVRAQQRAAALLPMPLWVIYSQFAAARDALGLAVDVDVEGSAEDAARLVKGGGGGGGGGSGSAAGGGAKGGAAAGGGAGGGGGGGAAPPPSKRRKESSAQPEEGVYKVRGWMGGCCVAVVVLSCSDSAGSSGLRCRPAWIGLDSCFESVLTPTPQPCRSTRFRWSSPSSPSSSNSSRRGTRRRALCCRSGSNSTRRRAWWAPCAAPPRGGRRRAAAARTTPCWGRCSPSTPATARCVGL